MNNPKPFQFLSSMLCVIYDFSKVCEASCIFVQSFHVFDSPLNVAFLMVVSLTRFTGLATMVLASTTMGGSEIKWLKAEIGLPV